MGLINNITHKNDTAVAITARVLFTLIYLSLNNPSTNAKINGVIIAIIGRLLINSILIL